MTPTAERLTALAAQLGETPAQVGATLHSELQRALRDIDAGLAAHDAEAVSRATHAARNSVLMLQAQPVLDALRALQDAAGRGDAAASAAARAQLERLWERLAAELRAGA